MKIETYTHTNKGRVLERVIEELWVQNNEVEDPTTLLDEDVASKIRYAMYEVGFTLDVDTETGDVHMTHVEGVELKEPVKV